MNFNASRNVGQGGGLRKAKRVSDVAAMGAPSPVPGFNPGPAQGYGQGFPPAGPPPAYEGIQLDSNQTHGFGPTAPSGDFNYMPPVSQSPVAATAMQFGSMLHQPVVQDMALQYGNQLAQQGKEAVKREFDRYVPVSRLRYYFAVDTRYVLKKLLLIVFPFTHTEWMVKYDQESSPVQPRYDLNAPDLYVPCMGYVTYVLLAGFMLGVQHRFSPEQISIQASSALAYMVVEMVVYATTLAVTGTRTGLRTLDLLAYSGYKYAPVCGALLAALALGAPAYYCVLLYTSLALSYFLVKTLRVQVLSGSGGGQPAEPTPYGYTPQYGDTWGAAGAGGAGGGGGGGTKRRVYFLLFVAITQPLLSWWISYHLVPATVQAAR